MIEKSPVKLHSVVVVEGILDIVIVNRIYPSDDGVSYFNGHLPTHLNWERFYKLLQKYGLKSFKF